MTHPITDDRLDLMRKVLIPAPIEPDRRKAELTAIILQLAASGRRGASFSTMKRISKLT